jgi:hypothetical protein
MSQTKDFIPPLIPQPTPADMSAEDAKHILGGQGNIWDRVQADASAGRLYGVAARDRVG